MKLRSFDLHSCHGVTPRTRDVILCFVGTQCVIAQLLRIVRDLSFGVIGATRGDLLYAAAAEGNKMSGDDSSAAHKTDAETS